MTSEVLDAAFRLFRAGLVALSALFGPCGAGAGTAHAVLDVRRRTRGDRSSPPRLAVASRSLGVTDNQVVMLISLLLDAALLGMITLRLHSIVARANGRAFAPKSRTALRRWPAALIATFVALGFPLLLLGLVDVQPDVPGRGAAGGRRAAVVADGAVRRGTAGVLVRSASGRSRRSPRQCAISLRRSLAHGRRDSRDRCAWCWCSTCSSAVLLAHRCRRCSGARICSSSPPCDRCCTLVVGAIGVPFVVAVLIVAYEDLKLRDQRAAWSVA